MSCVYNCNENFYGGTPHYASPEIYTNIYNKNNINNNTEIDWRKCDIWSIGIIIFSIINKEFPWSSAEIKNCNIYRIYCKTVYENKEIFWNQYKIKPLYKKLLYHSLNINPDERYNINQIIHLIEKHEIKHDEI